MLKVKKTKEKKKGALAKKKKKDISNQDCEKVPFHF
jgi:hypothetical protein